MVCVALHAAAHRTRVHCTSASTTAANGKRGSRARRCACKHSTHGSCYHIRYRHVRECSVSLLVPAFTRRTWAAAHPPTTHAVGHTTYILCHSLVVAVVPRTRVPEAEELVPLFEPTERLRLATTTTTTTTTAAAATTCLLYTSPSPRDRG